MNKILRSIIKPVISYGSHKMAMYQVSQLESSIEFVDPLYKTLNRELTQGEEFIISKIESRRSELLKSKETFNFVDYGTGLTGNGVKVSNEQKSVASAAQWSRNPFWSLFLFKLIRKLQPQRCLEMGACVGVSGSYMASALNLNNQGGALVTLEGCKDLANITKQTFEQVQLSNVTVLPGLFDETLEKTINEHGPFDFAYVDGNHSYEATVKYHNILKSQASGRPMTLVFDDIHWSSGMKKAWSEILNDPDVQTSLDLRAFGVCFLNQKASKVSYKIPIL